MNVPIWTLSGGKTMKSILSWLLRTAVTLCIVTSSFAVVSAGVSPPSTLDKIDQALSAGRLSRDLATLYKVYSVHAPEKLPMEYRPETEIIARCGTPVLLEALREMPNLSPSIQASITEAQSRPTTTNTYDSPGQYYKIHYDIVGTHAVPTADGNSNGIPDYVENLALYADSSWEHEILTIGWREPPSDGLSGGDSRYDIYAQSIAYYGYTQSETAGPEPWADYSSYIVVHNNFIGFPPNDDPDGNQAGAAKVTVAHEFNHACQYAYDAFDEFFIYELTAVSMEEEVFDIVNDAYNYLDSFFDYPYISLAEYSNHAYSTFIWALYLYQNYDTQVMPDIWEVMRYHNVYDGHDTALVARGTTAAKEMSLFTDWNYLTSFRDDGFHHEEAADYPYLNVNYTENTYPVSRSQTGSTRPQGWAANYSRFNPGTFANKILKVEFNGQNDVEWGYTGIGYRAGQECLISVADIDPVTGDGALYLPFFPDLDYIVGVATSLRRSTAGSNYVYTATALTPGDVNEDNNINPLDVVLLVNFVYKGHDSITPIDAFGDCNCDGQNNPIDVVLLVNYVYKSGDAPCE